MISLHEMQLHDQTWQSEFGVVGKANYPELSLLALLLRSGVYFFHFIGENFNYSLEFCVFF